jgi:hypothetical protein
MADLPLTLISGFFFLMIANGLNADLIGFEFPLQSNGAADILQIPVPTGVSPQAGLSLCLRIKLKFWDLKCLFNTQTGISMAMPNYKRGFVR